MKLELTHAELIGMLRGEITIIGMHLKSLTHVYLPDSVGCDYYIMEYEPKKPCEGCF